MEVAIVGLIGVVVGALVTSLFSWFTNIRQELGAGVVAARLLTEALAAGRGHKEWPRHQSILAGVLSYSDWTTVLEAVNAQSTGQPDTAAKTQNANKSLESLCRSRRSYWWRRRKFIR